MKLMECMEDLDSISALRILRFEIAWLSLKSFLLD
jgi:hypothetical protein